MDFTCGMQQAKLAAGPPEFFLQLDRMDQQAEVRTKDDDWTGRTSAAERRKLQNRLHQRKFRKQRRPRKMHAAEATESNSQDSSIGVTPTDSVQDVVHLEPVDVETALPFAQQAHLMLGREVRRGNQVTAAQVRHQIAYFENLASRELRVGSPRSDLLLTLIQFNVFRALVNNTFAMGFSFDWLSVEAQSPFNIAPPAIFDSLTQYPPNLRPTALQISTPHHPWIDLFPFPALRDNMLALEEDYEDGDLCYDLVETCHAPSERSGLIVWSDASRPESWEVTEEFARKWGWMLRGCEDLMRSTNMWRRQRGEDDLFVEVFDGLSVTDVSDSMTEASDGVL
ncbi:hypothetical protein ONS95_010329 [Cadophora gregata]|uniref:uncharacterized protein n=1 Tax=Cadophora gregata TaxID=51156 RepID=UPI0026DB3015|nr:uncharacterized protein ONS95_010329 [Cadophora gregata]KAK0122065.1 hypothetical protein ONS95_010329 [Cadophora gregata]KAK0127540.1 hypothetical protein ONS96_007075 [Cadophora gregata f. sp. sojae]